MKLYQLVHHFINNLIIQSEVSSYIITFYQLKQLLLYLQQTYQYDLSHIINIFDQIKIKSTTLDLFTIQNKIIDKITKFEDITLINQLFLDYLDKYFVFLIQIHHQQQQNPLLEYDWVNSNDLLTLSQADDCFYFYFSLLNYQLFHLYKNNVNNIELLKSKQIQLVQFCSKYQYNYLWYNPFHIILLANNTSDLLSNSHTICNYLYRPSFITTMDNNSMNIQIFSELLTIFTNHIQQISMNINIISNNDNSDDNDSNNNQSSITNMIFHQNRYTNHSFKKHKKENIPLLLKRNVWNTYIGEEIGKSKCYCCELTDITQFSFHCGHVISEYYGGKLKISNLRPICQSCNSSMGIMNLYEYKEKCTLY